MQIADRANRLVIADPNRKDLNSTFASLDLDSQRFDSSAIGIYTSGAPFVDSSIV